MSIFGPCSPTSGGASDTTGQEQDDLAEYAKKSHVNAQDALRILKAGDTMSGDLSLGGHVARGLPTAYPPLYQGDEAVSWAQAVSLVDGAVGNFADPVEDYQPATKGYVDRYTRSLGGPRKPVIAVWAEEKGPLDENAYEWSFGNGGGVDALSGFPMSVPGRVKSMALRVVPEAAAAHVALVVNGVTIREYKVTKSSSQRVGIVRWDAGCELALGDCINFQTVRTSNIRATAGIVSALIELDLE